jgi:uridine phosphorylase
MSEEQEATRTAHDEPLLTAANMLAWRHAQANAPITRLPEAAILTHQRFLLPRRRLPWRRDPSSHAFSFDTRPLAHGAIILAGVRGVGAPATAIAIEELAAAGVRRLVALGIGGSIDTAVRSGEVVVVDRAIACDGTSPHYAAEPVVRPNEALTKRLGERLTAHGIPFTTAAAWSTDAVYRETPSQLDGARRQGAVIADMETACVFAVAAALGIEAAVVLVAADELQDLWRPPADMSLVQARLRGLLEAATACLLP